jgi:hypothetical protein
MEHMHGGTHTEDSTIMTQTFFKSKVNSNHKIPFIMKSQFITVTGKAGETRRGHVAAP